MCVHVYVRVCVCICVFVCVCEFLCDCRMKNQGRSYAIQEWCDRNGLYLNAGYGGQ